MGKNTIKLKKYSDVIEEFVAASVIKPGALVTLNADGKVIPHNLDGGNAIPMFALEDELQGKTIEDEYATGDPVQVWVAGRGDIVYALANSGATINVGDFLVSAGDGTLKPAGTASGDVVVHAHAIIGQAISAKDASGRVKVRII